MTRAIRKHIGDFAAIMALVAIGLGATGYIIVNQAARPNIPLLEEKPVKMLAEFSDAQAVTPGQGQTVRVAGVEIGKITKVELEDGKAVVTMDIQKKFAPKIHRDASALLRPRTGLKDMFIELDPGSQDQPKMGENGRIGMENTAPDIDPDEVFQALDTDTRSYLQLLINGLGKGLDNNGDELREVFRLFEPLHRDLARVQGAFAERRTELARLIHNYGSLTTELADKDQELTRLVDASAAVFAAFAAEESNISETVRRLPSALRQTEDTLVKVDRLGDVLGPSLEALRPPFRQLDETNRAVLPFVREAEPIVRTRIRPFVQVARPYIRDLRPTAQDLSRAMPDLRDSFFELNRFFNIGAYNPGGREPLGTSREANRRRDEGYLFWLAWTAQNGNSVFSTADGSGPLRRLYLNFSCSTLRDLAVETPGADAILGVTNLLRDLSLCPSEGGPSVPDLPLFKKNERQEDPDQPQVSPDGEAAPEPDADAPEDLLGLPVPDLVAPDAVPDLEAPAPQSVDPALSVPPQEVIP